MRSRAERALRAIALAALGLLLWRTLQPADTRAATAALTGSLDAALVSATREAPAGLDLRLDSIPGESDRDWLGAIHRAGTTVTWRAAAAQPIAMAAEPVPEPEGRIRVIAAAADRAELVLSDGLGPMDTLDVHAAPASKVLRTATGLLAVSARGGRATVPAPASARVRRVLVIGSAGWESKFVIAALEEAGWLVDARIHVAPGVETRQGTGFNVDTTRYSAVVALDGMAASSASAIARFVGSGGGVVLAGAATRIPAFARAVPAVAGARRPVGQQRALVLTALKGDAVVLESQAGIPMVAARRSGHGRVISTGYDETWRWRMRAGRDAPAAHREWWSALVSAVAYVPDAVAAGNDAGDPAPFAALTAVLGPPAEPRPSAPASDDLLPPVWLLFTLLIASVLGEVISRRMRGLA